MAIINTGLGCGDPLAMNANSADSIPCVYGDATPPAPTTVNVTRPFGDVSGETASVPMDSLETWLYNQVVTPAAGSPTGEYMDPALMQAQLQQAAQQYCAGTSFGVASGPCAGADINSTVANLTQTYAAQVAAKGGTPSVNLNNATGYQFTSFAPGYDSGGVGYILMPNGSKVPNTVANLTAAQAQYNQSLGLPASYGTGGSAGAGAGASSDAGASAAPVGTVVNYTPSSLAPLATISRTSDGGSSAVTSINGASPVTQAQATTAPSWFTDPTQEVISGVPNWALAAAAAAAIFMFKK